MCGAKGHVRFAPKATAKADIGCWFSEVIACRAPLGVKDACDGHSILSDVTEWTMLKMEILIRRSPSTSPQKIRSSPKLRAQRK
jgi:hypothetical protein